MNNPLPIPLVIQRIKSNAGLNGTTFATFDHSFSPLFTIEPFQTTNSGNISNVNLTQVFPTLFLPVMLADDGAYILQGAIASLAIIPFGVLDIDSNITLL